MAIDRRNKYTQEFKEEAVKLVTELGYSLSEAAKNLEIHPNLLCRWKREFSEEPKEDRFAGSDGFLEKTGGKVRTV